MIDEERMLSVVSDLKSGIEILFVDEPETYSAIIEAIDLIPLGWQAANNREDSRVDVAMESDDNV